MQKITFQRGSVVPPGYLNELQKSIKFTSDPRSDYYAEPTSPEQSDWQITERDGLKGWEVDPRGSLGRLAHDGRVLGTNVTQIVYGPPSTTRYSPVYNVDSEFVGLNPDSELIAGSYGVIIESGSIISALGEKQSWGRTYFEVEGGQTLYALYESSLAELQLKSALPSRGDQFCPLAQITIEVNGDIEVVDLRSNAQVDNLFTYTRTFYNTPVISDPDYAPLPWERVLVDSTEGNVIITLPNEAEDGDQIIIVDAFNKFGENALVIKPDSEVLLQNSIQEWVVTEPGSIIELYFLQEFNSWRFKSGIKAHCEPEPGQFLKCGGDISAGVTLPENCPNGEALPIDSRYGISLGTYRYESGSMKCIKVISPAIAVYKGTTDYNYEPYALRCGSTRTSFKNWLTSEE